MGWPPGLGRILRKSAYHVNMVAGMSPSLNSLFFKQPLTSMYGSSVLEPYKKSYFLDEDYALHKTRHSLLAHWLTV